MMMWNRKTSVAWQNLIHNPQKLLTSLNGIVFSVVLMFMFTGFKNALYDSQLIFLQRLRGQLFLLSEGRLAFGGVGSFPRRVLYQAQSHKDIEQVYSLYSDYAYWKNPQTQQVLLLQVLAFNPAAPILDFPALKSEKAQLQRSGTALVDTQSLPSLGPIEVGTTTELSDRKIEIVGTFDLGTNFASINGNLIMSDQNFVRFFFDRDPKEGDRTLQDIDLGIVQLKSDADPALIANILRERLPDDIRVMTKAELLDWERRYWREDTNIGFIFSLLTLMGFVVGVVLVYQVLYSDITNNLSEYATLKAIGYKNTYLLRVIFEQAILLSILGFLPGFTISSILLNLTAGATGLVFKLTVFRVLEVYGFTLAMSLISGGIAVLRVQQADPAEVF